MFPWIYRLRFSMTAARWALKFDVIWLSHPGLLRLNQPCSRTQGRIIEAIYAATRFRCKHKVSQSFLREYPSQRMWVTVYPNENCWSMAILLQFAPCLHGLISLQTRVKSMETTRKLCFVDQLVVSTLRRQPENRKGSTSCLLAQSLWLVKKQKNNILKRIFHACFFHEEYRWTDSYWLFFSLATSFHGIRHKLSNHSWEKWD